MNAPRSRVYRALLDPDEVARWRVPVGMSGHVHEFDALTDERVVEVLEFETSDPTLGGTMTMTTTLADAEGGGTEVSIEHKGLPEGVSSSDNEIGSRMALAALAELVEAEHAG